jgi:hypothetical protein
MRLCTFAVSFVSLLVVASAADAGSVTFSNRMGTQIHVTIFADGNPNPVKEFDLADNPVVFNFTQKNFDIQIMPTDDPQSGFRHTNVPLEQFNGQDIPIGGERAKVMQCCIGRRHRCCCYCVDGERIATTLTATLPNGQMYFDRAPKGKY